MSKLTKEEQELKSLFEDVDTDHLDVVGRGLVVSDSKKIWESEKFQRALEQAEGLVRK